MWVNIPVPWILWEWIHVFSSQHTKVFWNLLACTLGSVSSRGLVAHGSCEAWCFGLVLCGDLQRTPAEQPFFPENSVEGIRFFIPIGMGWYDWDKKRCLTILLVTFIEWISDPFRSSVTSNQGMKRWRHFWVSTLYFVLGVHWSTHVILGRNPCPWLQHGYL